MLAVGRPAAPTPTAPPVLRRWGLSHDPGPQDEGVCWRRGTGPALIHPQGQGQLDLTPAPRRLRNHSSSGHSPGHPHTAWSASLS